MMYYLTENRFIHVLKILHLTVCMTFLSKISNLSKWSCVLNVCSEWPGLPPPDSEINCEEYVNLPSIHFHQYKNISSCSLHKYPFSDNEKNVLCS